jgi:hypothetical protein
LDYVVPYLNHSNIDVRVKCVEATCKLLLRREHSPPSGGAYGRLIGEILQRLLVAMTSDPADEVREAVIRSFSFQYDNYLAMTSNLHNYFFPLVQDNCPTIRRRCISLLGFNFCLFILLFYSKDVW